MDALPLAQLRSFTAPGPERLAAELLLGALVLIVLSIYVRGPIGTFFRFVVFVGAMAVIIGGTAILMNNVSLAGPPNPARRLQRFLTVNWAATSEKGDGAAACADPAQLASRGPADAEHHERRHVRRTAAQTEAAHAATPAATPAASAASAGAEDDYPELVRNAYPGIPPARLMQVVATTVSGLPGWQIVNSDPATLTINAVYHTRVLGLSDDVRIIVTPRSEVDVCSRSRLGRGESQTPLDLWRGDFGANIGHIKELYLALGPATNEAYRQVEIEQTAQQHGVKSPKP
ncbi:MAG TPA: DUF1499 domain-containing protein [Candidatus Binataceae bacterium]